MSAPKYCSWDVKDLASDYGWIELPTNLHDEGRMLSYYSSEHGGVRANVYLKTGTVATSLDHPTKGKTQLFRGQRDTYEKLEEIFENPRVHTDSGYRTRAKLREEEEGGLSEMLVSVDDEEGDDVEKLREEGDVASDFEDKDVMANLYREGRFEEEGEFDGESLMEKLMSKWDEEEDIDSDEIVLSGFKDTLELLNDEDYHRSVSEVDFAEATNSSEENESFEESEECGIESDDDEDVNESNVSLNDSDQHEVDKSKEGGSDESEESSSESDGCGTDSCNESHSWSDQASDDNFEESDDYSD